MSGLKRKKEEVLKIICHAAEENVHKLTSYWFHMYEQERCEEHLDKIVELVNVFFKDIRDEAEERHQNHIGCLAELREEADNLSEVLGIQFDINPFRDLPMQTAIIRIEAELNGFRKMLKDRRDEIRNLLDEQRVLCEELGEAPRELYDDPLPKEYVLQDFRQHLEILSKEKARRIEVVEYLRNEIFECLRVLEIDSETTTDLICLDDTHSLLTETRMEKLQKQRDDLRQRVVEMHNSIDAVKAKVEKLWNCLDVSSSIKAEFLKFSNNYTLTTYNRWREELERCEALKRQNIEKFVKNARISIGEWWDKTYKSDVERARFPYFTNNCYNDDLLLIHEMELDSLKTFYSTNENIFNLIEKRRGLWDRMMALEAKQSEPGRYNNRGGQLLKEEKERRVIVTKLPKIEAELTALVNKYETVNETKFLVHGEDILTLIARQWEMRKAEKDKMITARKNPTGRNSLNGQRTPLKGRNQSPMKKVASQTNLSAKPSTIKRKRLTGGREENIPPAAKRNLFHQKLSPPRKSTSRTNRSITRSSAKKHKIISSTIARRKSGLVSNAARKSINKSATKQVPVIKINDDEPQTSDASSYNAFQDRIRKDPSLRSSLNVSSVPRTRKRMAHQRNLTSPRRFNMSPSRSPGPSSAQKLTTKNLPILI